MPESDQKGIGVPEGLPGSDKTGPSQPGNPLDDTAAVVEKAEVSTEGRVDDGYNYYDDPYAYPDSVPEPVADAVAEPVKELSAAQTAVVPVPPATPPATSSGTGKNNPPPPSSTSDADDDEDDEGMLRMSFVEHLDELRQRIIRCLIGFGGAFLVAIVFANEIWKVISDPAVNALTNLGFVPKLVAIEPMEQFNTIWMKAPLIVAIFLASPVLVYQVWGFIAPGLYKKERRWALPFIICTSGLFILGGLFAYFVVFRFGLEFLLGLGRDANVAPMVTISAYFDMFVNVTLGVALVFELPVVIFFLTLVRIASPKFLLSKSRYAILAIVILAAVVTPTPDIFNLTMFTVPMLVLYFVGVFASYLLELNREGKKMPWSVVTTVILSVVVILGGAAWLIAAKLGYQFINHWPFLTK